MRLAAIVLAGGRGTRIGGSVNKVLLPIRDRAVIEYSVRTFQRANLVARVVIAIRPEDRSGLDHLTEEQTDPRLLPNRPLVPGPPLVLVPGGATRHQSEIRAIESIAYDIESGVIDLVAIHDGARPFMTLRLLAACVEAAHRFGGAVPGLPPEAPLYRTGLLGPLRPVPADTIVRAQTPQVFRARPLLAAYRASVESGFEGVDTAETIERFSSLQVVVVPGDERNIKMTFIEDLVQAEDLATHWDEGRWL